MGSNAGESMDVCKCIVPSRHAGNQNSCRAASSLVRLVEGEEIWETPELSQRVLSQKLGWNRAKSYRHLHVAQN
ncbi:hypothetical protein TNCV_2726241 [Trichonephila clavipes]|nr:hypothetical protein TNCV_2726241 [Trichonephila clavipes]